MENFSKELMLKLDEARKNGEKKVQANNYSEEKRKNIIGRELDIAYTTFVLENVNKIEDILQAQRKKLTTFIDTVKVIDKINKGETYEFENTLNKFALQGLLPIKFACHLLSEEDIENVHPSFVKYLENSGYRNNISELNKWEKISDKELNEFIENEKAFNFLDEEKGVRESE